MHKDSIKEKCRTRGMSFSFNCTYEILEDSRLETCRIGEKKILCLQFASSAHTVSEINEMMGTFCVFVQIQY